MFSKQDAIRLATSDRQPAVSIFLPTHVAGREIRQDPIRLKNLLTEAERRLEELGHRGPAAAGLLAPAHALVEDEIFWRYQDRGLALFLSEAGMESFKVPLDLEEQVFVGGRFHVKPLLPLLAEDGRFFVLTVTADRAALYEASRFTMSERDGSFPRSVAEVYGESDYENVLHANPVARPRSGAPGGVPKTQVYGESPEELRKSALMQYLNRIDKGVRDALAGETGPVVLAAQPEIDGNFRAVSELRTLLEDRVDVDPDALREEELHERAYALVRERFAERQEEALDQFNALFRDGSGRGLTRVEQILQAAHEGRVDTLFLEQGATLWGRYDEGTGVAGAHGHPRPGDEDLLDRAAVQTLVNGGHIHFVEKGRLPPGATAAAKLRY